MRTALTWTAAIAVSLLAHGGAATLFNPQPSEQAEVAGGEAMEVAVLGNAFEDVIEAGDPTEPLDPLEEQPEEIEPIDAEVAEAVPEEIVPVQSEVAAETPSDIPPVEADIILPADEMPPVAVAEAEVTATVPPVETVVPEKKPEQKPEPEKVEKRKEIKKPEPKKQKPVKKNASRPKAGEAGAAVASQKKGQVDGAETAKASTSQGKKGAFWQQSGNASVSNYKGKVRSKLARAFRYPSKARQGVTGVPWVRFTISASGAVRGLTISKSSGSPILDEAALSAVNRAAPFPPIPEGAGKNSWDFLIPMKFARGR
ncbi:cell envelope integrity protein TolA [Pararhizobium antarcticum]|uniref:Energy transducer TonB n=1 Tax=Pararhizobium antarcticum TaxID=1798805 RepID=A0A657LSH2_9HYPH|nr:energy transducer TonB [Pararhizobium antarcticum]OJF94349.1 energy transducer TonB [Rhizobium sp. 58]OJF96983.1 energy transducer TonB [Pararhizobium antarcticum]